MSKIPQRITSFKEYQMTVLSVQDKFCTYTSQSEITNQVCNYVKLLKPYYYDICERVYLARSALRYPDKNGYKDDFAKDNENNSLLKSLVEEIKKAYSDKFEEINNNLIRYMVYHVFKLLVDYLHTVVNQIPSFADYWEYCWNIIRNNVDIAFSAVKIDKEVMYKINMPYKSNGKMIWSRWVKVSVNKYMDPIDIKCLNTGNDQDVTKVSQHLDTSRLKINDNKIQLLFTVKRETPEAYKNNIVMSIDKGLNHFLAYHCESIDGVRTEIDHCISSSLRKEYYKAIDSGNKQIIRQAKYEILKYAVDDMINKIKECKPRFLIIENMVGSFADTDDKYVRAFPWVDYQKIIRRKAAEAGVHVILVYDNGTSQDYAYGDDQIIRNKFNRAVGYCKKSGEVVNCDENAALNIWARGVVKIMEYYLLTPPQIEEIKRLLKDRGRTLATVNYSTAKDVIEYCRRHFGICKCQVKMAKNAQLKCTV